MRPLRILLTVLCTVVFIALMGACAMQDYFTPCFIDPRVGDYTDTELTDGLFTSIADAKRLGQELNFVHIEKREALLQEIEKDTRLHSFLTDAMRDNLIDANELQKTLFSPTGAFGAMTGLLGLGAGAVFIKRPGDLRKEDVEDA